ncbi:MAG: hypothetical protein WEB03_04415 [Nitriliruptor sp.]|uniref:hypothetical protein n=1 Tax=Nitriliruptor sp. TaxID=2448056 RepID=UPI0034A0070D
MRHRVTTTSLLTGLVLVVGAAPAAADPAGPTNYTSSVTGVEPATDTISVAVRGGDAFVELTAAPGTTVEVAGYDDEPFLRFQPDGTVERNEASPARWLNDARYGAADTTVPPEASSDAPPRWEPVAEGGTYAWHDHRVHWMTPTLPRNVDPGADGPQRVTAWELPLTVDGEPVTVSGELGWEPSVSALPAGFVALLVLGAGVAAASRFPAASVTVTLVGVVAAGTVGLAGSLGLPPGADSEPALVLLPAVALALVGVGLAVRGRAGLGPELIGALAGVPLLVWSVLLLRALTAPIVPTSLPDVVARLLVAVALGAGLASLVAAGRAVLALPGQDPAAWSGRDAVAGS